MLKRGLTLTAALTLIGGQLLVSVSVAAAAPITPQFTITADRAAAVPAGHRWAFNDFFPRTATIETGGTFQFTNEGPDGHGGRREPRHRHDRQQARCPLLPDLGRRGAGGWHAIRSRLRHAGVLPDGHLRADARHREGGR